MSDYLLTKRDEWPTTARPDWELESTPTWYLEPGDRATRTGIKSPRARIYRATAAPVLIERSAVAEEAPLLSVRFAVFNRWTEINSAEGHFMERIAPGAFRKTISENLANVRAILSHGKDASLGMTVLGKIEAIQESLEEAVGRVRLFPSVPALLVDGLKAGVYGACFNGRPIKQKIEYKPRPSEFNPDGLPQVTRQEIALRDIGPTPFAAYAGTSATIGAV